MIDHSQCTHPRTPSGRAKCRRGKAEPWPAPPLYSLGPPPKQATPKMVGEVDNYGQTPKERWLECDNCGVERIHYRGTDPITGILRFVGERCLYTIKRADDLTPLDW